MFNKFLYSLNSLLALVNSLCSDSTSNLSDSGTLFAPIMLILRSILQKNRIVMDLYFYKFSIKSELIVMVKLVLIPLNLKITIKTTSQQCWGRNELPCLVESFLW